ncbi:MAG: DUF3761 domain-containing protein [Janthinobacterium lividum]
MEDGARRLSPPGRRRACASGSRFSQHRSETCSGHRSVAEWAWHFRPCARRFFSAF